MDTAATGFIFLFPDKHSQKYKWDTYFKKLLQAQQGIQRFVSHRDENRKEVISDIHLSNTITRLQIKGEAMGKATNFYVGKRKILVGFILLMNRFLSMPGKTITIN